MKLIKEIVINEKRDRALNIAHDQLQAPSMESVLSQIPEEELDGMVSVLNDLYNRNNQNFYKAGEEFLLNKSISKKFNANVLAKMFEYGVGGNKIYDALNYLSNNLFSSGTMGERFFKGSKEEDMIFDKIYDLKQDIKKAYTGINLYNYFMTNDGKLAESVKNEASKSLLATSRTMDDIISLISKYFYGSTITLKEVGGNVWDVYNLKGVVRGFQVVLKGGVYRFEELSEFEESMNEGWKHSPEFQRALDQMDTQALTAEVLGRNAAMNPEVIWNWAKKHNIDLVMKAHIYMKDLTNFVSVVMSDNSYTDESVKEESTGSQHHTETESFRSAI